MENTKVSKNIVYLVDIIQKEINKQCCLPEGYNADLELEDDNKELLGLKAIGITVTDIEKGLALEAPDGMYESKK
jgi:hypothetical protein